MGSKNFLEPIGALVSLHKNKKKNILALVSETPFFRRKQNYLVNYLSRPNIFLLL